MTSQQILQSDLLDILFEKRNKLYGAYLLRKNYDKELLKAIGITALLILGLLLFANPSPSEAVAKSTETEYTVTSIAIPTKQPELPKPKIQQPAATQQVKTDVLNANIKTVDRTTTPIATQNTTAAIGGQNIQGPVGPHIQPPQPPIIDGGGTEPTPPKKEETPLITRRPEFPGGNLAWLRFLERNLQVPEDLDAGEKRVVQIKFWVDEEGTVTNFQVAQSGGSAFDNEVIRVLKKMPKWLPALQSGKPVAVSFTQPVTFTATEQ